MSDPKHLIQLKNSFIKISDISRIVYDPSDNTVKVVLAGRENGDTGWCSCTPGEFKEIISKWDSYIERSSSTPLAKTKEVDHV